LTYFFIEKAQKFKGVGKLSKLRPFLKKKKSSRLFVTEGYKHAKQLEEQSESILDRPL